MAKADKKGSVLFLFIAFLWLSTGCQNNPTTTTNNAAPDTVKLPADTAKVMTLTSNPGCFAYMQNRDTVLLSLSLKGSTATGKLVYHLFEKDKNVGTINGRLLGDTLLADYTFVSEGLRSVREVIFLVKGNILVEGNGIMKEHFQKLVFINRRKVDFTGNIILSPADCALLNPPAKGMKKGVHRKKNKG